MTLAHTHICFPILWSPDVKNWLIRKDPDAGKDWRQEEKGTTEDEMVGWHHWLNGHEFEQAQGVGDGQGGLLCCSPWSCKESDMTEWLNWTVWHYNMGQSERTPSKALVCASYSLQDEKRWGSGGGTGSQEGWQDGGGHVLVPQSFPTLRDPMDHSPPGSSVHRIL